MLVVEPIPRGDNNVALNSLGPRGLRMGQLALGDPVRPVAEITESRAAKFLDSDREHLFAGLPGLDAAKPRFLRILERWKRMRHILRERARGERAQLMAVGAAVDLHQVHPFILG